jgi:hypothetical protein
MEQAPPPRSGTPQLYMTPIWAKRKDGLCPSLLLTESAKKAASNSNLKSYRTNSNLLLQIQEPNNGLMREAVELTTIVDSIQIALDGIVNSDGDIASVRFNPIGCSWHLELSTSLHEAVENYSLEVILKANELSGIMNYLIDTIVLPKHGEDTTSSAPPLPGFREAKGAFDYLALVVRKAVVGLEFPEFPEGCKGRPFREVYQLNARVSYLLSIFFESSTWKYKTNTYSYFCLSIFSLNPDHSQLCVEVRIEQRVVKWPLNVFCGRICLPQTTQLYTMKWLF